WQESSSVKLPSSHCSPTSRTPSPQNSLFRQSPRQPSPLTVLPSSHTSPGSTTPLPHNPEWQAPPAHAPAPPVVVLHGSPSSIPSHTLASPSDAQPPVVQTSPTAHDCSPHGTRWGSMHPTRLIAMTTATRTLIPPRYMVRASSGNRGTTAH